MYTYRDKPFRSLVLPDTFDRLTAPVEHRYVWSELQRWSDDTGLVVEAAAQVGVGPRLKRTTKPARPSGTFSATARPARPARAS